MLDIFEKYKWNGHLADMEEVLPRRVSDHLFTFSSFLLCFRAVPTFDTIIMPFGDELAACCGFTTAFAIKTAFPYCWEVLTRVLEPNSKAAYRCYKSRLENKFSYLVLLRWTLMLPQFHIGIELQPCCLATPYAFYPQLNVSALQFRKRAVQK